MSKTEKHKELESKFKLTVERKDDYGRKYEAKLNEVLIEVLLEVLKELQNT